MSLLPSVLVDERFSSAPQNGILGGSLVDSPPYFCWETPLQQISIIQNDWPYSGKYAKSGVTLL